MLLVPWHTGSVSGFEMKQSYTVRSLGKKAQIGVWRQLRKYIQGLGQGNHESWQSEC